MTCTEKLRFETRAEAKRVLRQVQSAPRRLRAMRPLRPGYEPGALPRSVYKCRQCGGYHLTSQTA